MIAINGAANAAVTNTTSVTNSQTDQTDASSKVDVISGASQSTTGSYVSSEGDTLDISEQGLALAANMTSETDVENDNAKSVISSVTSDSENDSDDSTLDLSSYSAYELSKMLAEGAISAAQYAAELKRRENTDSEDQAAQQTVTAANIQDPTNIKFQMEV